MNNQPHMSIYEPVRLHDTVSKFLWNQQTGINIWIAFFSMLHLIFFCREEFKSCSFWNSKHERWKIRNNFEIGTMCMVWEMVPAGKNGGKERESGKNARQYSNLTLNFTYCAIYYMGNKCKFCSQCRCITATSSESNFFSLAVANECALSIEHCTLDSSFQQHENVNISELSTNRSETNSRTNSQTHREE